MWRTKTSDSFLNSFYGIHSGTVTELFEFAKKQPEVWVITSVVEIGEEEYKLAKSKGELES